MSQNKGFTLIELLVVIAIIGILAAAALASLGSARTKGQQAAVKSQLANMRAQAELYFSTNNNYGTGYAAGYYGATGTTVLPTASCATTVGTGMFGAASANLGLDGLIKGACTSGATAITAYTDAATATKWAVKAALPGGGESCVDSNGNSKSSATTVTVTSVVCQ